MKKNPLNTIYKIRKIIGKKFDDIELQNLMKTIPYKIRKDNNYKPKIIVQYFNEERSFYPEETFIIKQLKKDVENYLYKEVKDAILTVPAYFNNLQIESIKEAGRMAGLNILKLIDEPIAASIAYKLIIINIMIKKIF